MDTTTILWTTFISLTGLEICTLEKEEKRLASMYPLEDRWCPSPYLRLLYEIIHFLGVVFVLFGVGYMSFAVHWWYFLVYFILALVAKIAAILVFVPFALIWDPPFCNHYMFGSLQYRRLIGSIIIIIGPFLFLIIQ